MLDTSAWWSMPSAVLALPCGSMSMTRTCRPAWASAAATLTVVVVLPTPPFWFATVRIRVWSGLGKTLPGQRDPAAGVHGYLPRQRRVVVGGRQLGSQRGALQLHLGQAASHRRLLACALSARFTWNVRSPPRRSAAGRASIARLEPIGGVRAASCGRRSTWTSPRMSVLRLGRRPPLATGASVRPSRDTLSAPTSRLGQRRLGTAMLYGERRLGGLRGVIADPWFHGKQRSGRFP